MTKETHQGHSCGYCGGSLRITRLSCDDCNLAYEGHFTTPRLARLSREEQLLVELFVLSSGSLKRVAEAEDISYPTVRNRLDRLIERLVQEKENDQKYRQRILKDIEDGRIKPKQGMRMIEGL
jgi:hypothetical protein